MDSNVFWMIIRLASFAILLPLAYYSIMKLVFLLKKDRVLKQIRDDYFPTRDIVSAAIRVVGNNEERHCLRTILLRYDTVTNCVYEAKNIKALNKHFRVWKQLTKELKNTHKYAQEKSRTDADKKTTLASVAK